MRKIFEAPAMSINKFAAENVVTTSGGPAANPTMEEALADKIGNVSATQKTTWNNMNVIF